MFRRDQCRPGFERIRHRCTPCEPGYFKSLRTTSNTCEPCPCGYFQSARGSLLCQKCPNYSPSTKCTMIGAKHISYCYKT